MFKQTLFAAVAATALGSSLYGATLSLAPAAEAEVLNYAGTTPALTMDPHATNDFVTTAIFRQVYDSLVGLSLDMEIVPGIAESWEYLGDNTWRFQIREGVVFHDGRPLTAADVAFSIMRQKDSRFYTALFGGIEEAVAVDDYTVDVISSAPDPILPRKMTRLFIMSQSWLEENDSLEIPDLGAEGAEGFTVRNANGTGPMMLTEHNPQVITSFVRNENYWGDFPGNVTEANYTPIGSAPTRVAALLSGEVQLITDLPLQDIERIEGSEGFEVVQTPQFLWMQLEMDGTRDVALDTWNNDETPIESNPFADTRVRQAIAHAIDAQLIVDRVMRGNARVVGIASAPGLGGYQEDLDVHWEFDPERSRALLAEAGYPDGFITQLNCPLERYVNTEETCRAVASMLDRIGIEVRVNGMVWPEFARMLVNGPTSSFHLIGTGPNSFDTQDTFTAVMMTRDAEANEGFFNWALYSNETVDMVANELPVTFDEARRQELYRIGLEEARETVSSVYLHQLMITWGMQDSVEAPIRSDATLTLQNVVIGE